MPPSGHLLLSRLVVCRGSTARDDGARNGASCSAAVGSDHPPAVAPRCLGGRRAPAHGLGWECGNRVNRFPSPSRAVVVGCGSDVNRPGKRQTRLALASCAVVWSHVVSQGVHFIDAHGGDLLAHSGAAASAGQSSSACRKTVGAWAGGARRIAAAQRRSGPRSGCCRRCAARAPASGMWPRTSPSRRSTIEELVHRSSNPGAGPPGRSGNPMML